MIIGNVGTPGSGKTYDAVGTIIANLRRGRRVYTNIEGLDGDQQRRLIQDTIKLDDYEFNKTLIFLQKDEVKRFWEIAKDGSLIVLDEVHKDFSNRDWNSAANKVFADWASTHRHHGFDLILITQDIEKVDKHVRSLIEWTYFFRKVNFFGGAVQQKYLRYSYTGDDHNGKPLAKAIKTYDPFIFNCYKSFATSDAKEVGFMTHVNILKHPVFFILPCIILLSIYLFSKSSFAHGDLFGVKDRIKKTGVYAAPPVKPVAAPGAAVGTPGPPGPVVPAAAPAPQSKTLPAPSAAFPVQSWPPPAHYAPMPKTPPLPPSPAPAPSRSTGSSVAVAAPVPDPLTALVWTDENGVYHVSNDPPPLPSGTSVALVTAN